MGRAGISFTEVQRACEQLVASNKSVTVDNIREITGTGSRGTLSRLKKQWEALGQEQGQVIEGELLVENEEKIEERLLSLVSELKNLTIEEAKAICSRNDEKHEEEIEEQKGYLAEAERRNEALTEKFDALKVSQDKLQLAYDGNVEQLKLEIEFRSKAEETVTKKDEQIQLLQEQIESLEQKYQHACNTLEHARQAAKEQRDQDQQNWEHQQSVYQQQIKGLQNDLSSKNTNISSLSEANGQLSQQNQSLNKEVLDKGRQLTEALDKVTKLEPALQESTEKTLLQQEKITELTVANARLEQAEQDKNRLVQRISDIEDRHQKQIEHYQKMLDDSGQQLTDQTNKLEMKTETVRNLEKRIRKLKADRDDEGSES